MKQIVLVIGTVYGLLSVVLGAFGSHLFKKLLSDTQLVSFETGVRYQMYHAIVLLLVGYMFSFQQSSERIMGWLFIFGVLFFSFTIYLLSFQKYFGMNLKFLGPITPLGGALLITAWVLLIVNIIKNK